MAYTKKTWANTQTVFAEDANRWETGIDDLFTEKENLVKNAAEKATLVDNDTLVVVDSADSSKTKRYKFSTLKALMSNSVKGGSGSFSGATGTEISHGFGNIATNIFFVTITPSANGSGNIGEYYVVKQADGKFKVYNTGNATTAFDWMAVKVNT